mgnify:CR=1 FL=1
MTIQVNTDSQTKGSADWSIDIQGLIQEKLSRFADRITRVEVHLNDENSASKSGGNDKRCQVEVRIAGMQPISVTDHADSQDQALHNAVDKVIHLIETTFGKLSAAR